MECKHCGESGTHYCRAVERTVSPEKDTQDFINSALIAAVTDSGIVGAVVGGSILGAFLGDAFDGDIFD